MNLRQAAKDKPCILCGSTGTTVLHHIRIGGNAGTGMKPPDWHGIDVCDACHRYFHGDGRADYRLQLTAYTRQVERWLTDGLMAVTQ